MTDRIYAVIGHWGVTTTICFVLGALAALVYCSVQAMMRGVFACVIDTRNRKLIRVASRLSHLQLMTPNQFEHLCQTLFTNQGYKVHVTEPQNDAGVDLVMSKDDAKVIVQCKRIAKQAVGRPLLQQFYGAFEDNQASHGFFITTSYFSRPAREFAKGKQITLIDGRQLVLWVNLYAGGHLEADTPAANPVKNTQTRYAATCTECGSETTVPFKPLGIAPIRCDKCYRAQRKVS